MIMKQKLLFMGIDTSTRDAVAYARSIGVETIITDARPFGSSPVKQMADHVWQIDVKNLDELQARCKKEQITGIYAGNHEFCLDMTRELTRRLELPFYASEEGWACARDKARFKEHCMAVGLDVPQRYFVKKPYTQEMFAKISYPVIVKPVDACAQRGLTLCGSEEELITAYEKALQYSQKKEVIVEEFIEGEEVSMEYFFLDGHPVFCRINDLLPVSVNNRPIFCFIWQQSRHKEKYLRDTADKTDALFQRMQCYSGAAFLQAIYRDGKYYFLEFGYRIDGIGSWTTEKRIDGYSKVERMVDLALGRPFSPKQIILPEKNGVGALYLPLVKAGKIDAISGLETVRCMEGVDVSLERFHIGDEIKESKDMYQLAYYLGIWAEKEATLLDRLKEIQSLLKICDHDGNNLLIPFDGATVREILRDI